MNTNKRRFLFISDEIKSGDIKCYTHFDIITGKNLSEVYSKLFRLRPKITNHVYLTMQEVSSILLAMQNKTDKQIEDKFKENIKNKL